SWSARGDMDAVRRAFGGFHEDVQKVLANCPSVHQWALFERDPLPRWTEGAIALLGDACHPMTPYMAQGAATALEDAATIARCLAAVDDPGEALRRYEAGRARTALPASSLPRGRITGVRAPPIRDGSTATTRSKR